MVGFPNFPVGWDPTKNDHHLGCEMGKTHHLGVSKNGGTPKWMVMENLIKMDDLGVPLFSETSI